MEKSVATVIVVPLQAASDVITILKDQGIIDRYHRILKSDTSVYIPITQPDFQLASYPVTEMPLEELPKHHQSIKTYLSEQLPSQVHEFIPTSFDQIGDIAVIDIPDQLAGYYDVIGAAILAVHRSIKAVYRKSHKVTGAYRVRGLEYIFGEQRLTTVHTEYGISIYVDLSKVYFSPRLSTEHHRIASMVEDGETVLDMFTAAGPYPFHILSHTKASIHAIDLNPVTKEVIKKSLTLNKHLLGPITTHIGDAHSIVPQLVTDGLLFDRIIMNHPSGAIEFMDEAVMACRSGGTIHLYLFAPIANTEAYITNLVTSSDLILHEIHSVRRYAPDESHFCFTFKKK